ncbi:hypothetical protein [Streptomyces sp. NPDC056987]
MAGIATVLGMLLVHRSLRRQIDELRAEVAVARCEGVLKQPPAS